MWGRLGWFEAAWVAWVVVDWLAMGFGMFIWLVMELVGKMLDTMIYAWRVGSEFDFGLLHMCTSTYHNFASPYIFHFQISKPRLISNLRMTS